ncbi:restriction system modified-DNA reader domain-containing protein [Glycomyces terrestris]|nr:MGMT family protein [Glycomyces terrestris]
MVSVEISEDLYQYIQKHAVPLEDSVDSVLKRLLGLDKAKVAALAAEAPAQPSGTTEHGALQPLVTAGLLNEGDELRWHRAKKGVTFDAKVGPNGTIELDDGQLFESPSGAAVAVAGGNHPGWDVWSHLRSGMTLSQLRSMLNSANDQPTDLSDDWKSQLKMVLSRLPHGAWTSYGDLGRLLGRNPRELGLHLSTTEITNAHRVLQHNGRISPGFHWVGTDRGDVRVLLRREGVLPQRGSVADPSQRLSLESLRKLLQH